MINKYLIGGAVVLAVVGGAWFHGNYHGKLSERSEYQQKVIDYQEAQNILVGELAKAQAENQRKTQQKVRTIYVEKDDTGCADNPALNSVLESLGPDRSE